MLLLKGILEIWGPSDEMVFLGSPIKYLCWRNDDTSYLIEFMLRFIEITYVMYLIKCLAYMCVINIITVLLQSIK